MHAQIRRHFENSNYIGFTGTPIFKENKGPQGQTTADIFQLFTVHNLAKVIEKKKTE